jgi:uncharacterized protein (DUF885 family)
MSRRILLLLTCLIGGGFLSLGISVPRAVPDEPTPFAAFVDDYFDGVFAWGPSTATQVGFHQYDDRFEDRSAAAVARRVAQLKLQRGRLASLRERNLSSKDAIDAEVLDGLIRAELLDLETLQTWRLNPMEYVALPGGAVDALMKRTFAPPGQRLRAIVARLRAAPALLQTLRVNVTNPPREFTNLAQRLAAGSVGFFRDDVAAWAREAAGNDADLLRSFTAANSDLVCSLEQTVTWLKDDLLPQSKGSYALGAEHFAQKLRYEELVDIPLPRLLAIGEANLQRDYDAFVATARQINPQLSPGAVMQSLSNDHPSADDLIPSARRTIEKIRQFLIDHHIVTVPSDVRPTVQETPPYARNGSFASMDTPGPYETRATEAFYYVTPVEKEWDAKHREEHLRLFNTPVMQLITIHEAFPGHYIQFLYAKQYPTKTRKLASCNTNAEGWAHYTEQMMVDEGYGNGDPKIRLAQLSEALLRDCRYVVGIKLHTQGMTVAEGKKVFIEKGFQQPAVAFEEARRGAYDPTYLYYTLGKLQILKLRADYRQAQGSAYRLQAFHDAFVRQGAIPIKLIRRILLPGDREPAL